MKHVSFCGRCNGKDEHAYINDLDLEIPISIMAEISCCSMYVCMYVPVSCETR